MIELWIPITIAAAFLQNLRSALQKAIKGRLSTMGAAYARFFYAWPLALLYVWGLAEFGGYETPPPNTLFLIYCALGGLSQILFTVVLLWMFSFRSFAFSASFSAFNSFTAPTARTPNCPLVLPPQRVSSRSAATESPTAFCPKNYYSTARIPTTIKP